MEQPLTLSFRWSSVPRTCWRCVDEGRPADGIPAGEKHVVITGGNLKAPEYACAACYEKVLREVLGSQVDPEDASDDEGEEWKRADD